MSEDGERDLEILRLQAETWALQSLCIALFKVSQDQEGVLQRFALAKEGFVASLLAAEDIDDAVFRECDMAHERILGLLKPSGKKP